MTVVLVRSYSRMIGRTSCESDTYSVRPAPPQHLADAPLVGGVGVRVQQADGDAPRRPRATSVRRGRSRLRQVERHRAPRRCCRSARRPRAAARARPAAAACPRTGRTALGTRRRRKLEHVAEAARGQQAGQRALALEDRVGRDGRAVDDVADGLGRQRRASASRSATPSTTARPKSSGVDGSLRRCDPASASTSDDIGERAADVSADAGRRVSHVVDTCAHHVAAKYCPWPGACQGAVTPHRSVPRPVPSRGEAEPSPALETQEGPPSPAHGERVGVRGPRTMPGQPARQVPEVARARSVCQIMTAVLASSVWAHPGRKLRGCRSSGQPLASTSRAAGPTSSRTMRFADTSTTEPQSGANAWRTALRSRPPGRDRRRRATRRGRATARCAPDGRHRVRARPAAPTPAPGRRAADRPRAMTWPAHASKPRLRRPLAVSHRGARRLVIEDRAPSPWRQSSDRAGRMDHAAMPGAARHAACASAKVRPSAAL